MDSFASLRSVSLISAGGNQDHAGWRRLEAALGGELAREEVSRNLRGINLLLAGLLGIGVIVWEISLNPQTIAHSLLDIAQTLLKMVGL